MSTEDVSPRYADLDSWTNIEALRALYEAQLAAVAAVAPALPALAAAVESAASLLRGGGRLVYAGAGTSGRIAVQDGAELAPMFDWPPDRVAFAVAGGEAALLRSVERAEDLAADASARMDELGVGAGDVVIGVAASGSTPFTVAAVASARRRGALTIGIANNAGSELLTVCDHPILVETGAEPIAGSTRLKAGTAQKIALNLFSTQVMVRLGRVYRGRMVNMRPTNEKLRRRAIRIVADIAGCDEAAAAEAMTKADGDAKLAALIARGVERAAAARLLDKHEGRLRAALAELS